MQGLKIENVCTAGECISSQTMLKIQILEGVNSLSEKELVMDGGLTDAEFFGIHVLTSPDEYMLASGAWLTH